MYQPISFNVIRQALEWHNFPVPTIRQLSFHDMPDQEIIAEYYARWTTADVVKVTGMSPGWQAMYARIIFTEQLRQCFCEDIEATELLPTPLEEGFSCLIYVRISREVAAVAFGDWLTV